MKKALLILAATLLLASCGGGGDPATSPSDPVTSSEPIVEYTVTLINSRSGQTISTSTVEEGETFAKPADPAYASHLFAGWYMDSGLTEEASFPLTVNGNISIYAKFNSYIEHFIEGRDRTILDSERFHYTSSTNLTVSYSALELSGTQEGETRFNSESEVSFREEHENGGVLFYDGFKTSYKKGNTLFTISENEDHDVTDYKTETVDSSYRYDSSSFAKALFEYKEEDIESVSVSGNRYELKTKHGYSSVASLVLGQVNNPMVEKILGNLPDTASDFHMYVTFDGNYLGSYSYSFSVTVSGVSVSVTYDLAFVDNGGAVVISEPSFPGLYLSDSEITNVLGTITSGINSYKAQEYSAYDYVIDTTVETPSKSVGVKSQGKTLRKVSGGEVYYNNRLEVDSELKDADMYESAGVVDYERYRAKLADGSVYDAEDRVWPLSNLFTEVTTPLASDEFYGLLPNSYFTSAYVDAVQKTSETAYDEYSIIVSQSLFLGIMDYVDEITRVDATLAKHYPPLGTYDEDTVVMKDASFLVNLSNGIFTGLTIKLHGAMTTSYADTTVGGASTFDLSITITSTNEGQGYVIPETTDDIQLN